jgi:chromosome partitioning protein
MKVITIASGKGGSCKTTVTATLAVRAAKESDRVAMMDLNEDQGSLTDWWIIRRRPKNPILIEVEDVAQDIAALREDGYEWLFLDTPPFRIDLIEAAVAVADLVVIPVRPSLMDISATRAVTSLCRKYRKPFAFLLAGVVTTMKKQIEQTKHALAREAKPGGSVMAQMMTHRAPYIEAMNYGKSAEEVDKSFKSEVDNIWAEVQQLVEPRRKAAE